MCEKCIAKLEDEINELEKIIKAKKNTIKIHKIIAEWKTNRNNKLIILPKFIVNQLDSFVESLIEESKE
jgi:hypothetical protein